jgi:hypothetical protein
VTLLNLHKNSPRAICFDELWNLTLDQLPNRYKNSAAEIAELRSSLADALLGCYHMGLIELHFRELGFVLQISEKPVAFPYARLLAKRGESLVINLYHRSVKLEAFDQVLLPYLDGTKDRPALLQEFVDLAKNNVFTVQHKEQPVTDRPLLETVLGNWIDASLHRLAGLCLLVQ